MIEDDSARVPFAVIGILMIIISTITAAYLLKMGSSGVSGAIADEREGELNDALACSKADIDNALNVACIYAENEAGESPVVNVSEKCPYSGGADEVNLARIKRMAYRNLSQYLEANYNGDFTYGDYVVNATIDGDYGSVSLETVAMNLTRAVYPPLLQCRDMYDAYYTASVPVRLRITRPGTSFDYTETYSARTLVTSRYPLLKELTGEYESRLNGTAMLADLTAASYAYTWARGYCQYFAGEPLNIVDNGDLELVANAASLLEQGCVYNSVDPVSLASLAKHTYDDARSTTDVIDHNNLSYINQYNFSNTSRQSLPDGRVPDDYRFNADDIVDQALRSAIADMSSRYYLDRAYGCRMHITVSRRPLAGTYNDTGSVCLESYSLTPNGDGTGPFFREVWQVHNGGGGGWAEEVTVDYVMDECSLLESHDDVLNPHKESMFEPGGRSYADSNLAGAVDGYNRIVPLQNVLPDKNNYPDGYSGMAEEFPCEHNEWVESECVLELKSLAEEIKGDTGVTLKYSDYGSYGEMADAAYGGMRAQFLQRYPGYLMEAQYRENSVFRTCGSKYIYYKRSAFLENVSEALNATVGASRDVDRKVDEGLDDYSASMNSSTMKEGARTSGDLLDNARMLIPFGLNMTLESRADSSGPYTWNESVALAIDQRPDYLDVDEYRDPETGYAVRPLKVRNVCVFTLPTDIVDSGRASEAVLDGIDAVSGAASKLANETVAAESSRLVEGLSVRARQAMKGRINDALIHDDELQGQVTVDEVNDAVDKAFEERSPGQVVQDLKNGALQQEIVGDIGEKAKKYAEQELAKKADRYVDVYGGYIEAKAEEAVKGAEEEAVSSAIGAARDGIRQTFEDFMAGAAGHEEDAAIGNALKRIPAGLPLLPPWGWWATMNVWYIEVRGEIPYLAAYDTDNEPVPDGILGQRAAAYVRRPMLDIRDGDDVLGSNEPIRFSQRTCVFIIVPPGEQGIGDKADGWDEKSPGYDEAEAT